MAPRTNVSIREPAVHRIADTPLGDTIANIAHDTRYIMTCTSHHSEVSALLSCVLLHIVAVGGMSSGTKREWQRVRHDELHHALANLPECVNVL